MFVISFFYEGTLLVFLFSVCFFDGCFFCCILMCIWFFFVMFLYFLLVKVSLVGLVVVLFGVLFIIMVLDFCYVLILFLILLGGWIFFIVLVCIFWCNLVLIVLIFCFFCCLVVSCVGDGWFRRKFVSNVGGFLCCVVVGVDLGVVFCVLFVGVVVFLFEDFLV